MEFIGGAIDLKLMEPLTESHYIPSLAISSTFDGGNITCIAADSPDDIRLKILKDNGSDFYRWLYFRLTGARRQACKLHITNAGKSAYTKGWEGYNAVASDDRQTWRRVPTSCKNGVLTIEYTPQADAVWFAYFAPYTMERHNDLIARVQKSPYVVISVLGKTLDGQDMDLLQIGEPGPDKRICWAVARQHPGETMAEWRSRRACPSPTAYRTGTPTTPDRPVAATAVEERSSSGMETRAVRRRWRAALLPRPGRNHGLGARRP